MVKLVLCDFHVCACFCSSSGVPAMCTAHLHPLLCSERHGSHRPHVPVLSGCLHRALHYVHREEPAQLQTGGTHHQPQRLPHLCCLQVNESVRLLVSSALFAAKLACLKQTCLCQDILTCVIYFRQYFNTQPEDKKRKKKVLDVFFLFDVEVAYVLVLVLHCFLNLELEQRLGW